MLIFIKLLFSAFAQAITSMLFILIVIMAYVHIQKNTQLEEYWLGVLRNSISNQLLNVVLYGMIAGLTASVVIVFLGITIDYNAVMVIWPLALFLMLFNQRYLCFSYAGGIASLSSLIFGWPRMDVSAIIALVGILHLMESMLILMDGTRDSLPVFMEHKRFKPIGAYLMRRLWPIPLIVLVVPPSTVDLMSGGIQMPDWWPLFRTGVPSDSVMLWPIVAALGYGDLAVTQTPRARTRESGFWLGAYSLVILILAVISSRIYWVKYLAAVCTPVLHEILIYFGKRGQMEGSPAFAPPWRGLRVLEVMPESVAEKMGVKRGDILISARGKNINSEEMLTQILEENHTFFWVDIKRDGGILTFEYRDYENGVDNLGILFVPKQTGKYFLIDEQKGTFFKIWRHFFGRDNRSMDV